MLIRYSALVLVGGYGGLRIGEIAGLQVGDLEMLKGILNVERQVVEIAGKLEIGPLKTRAARRKVRLPRIAIDALAEHLAPRGSSVPSDDLVFPAPGGGLLSRTMFRQRFFVPACEAAGLDGLRVHDLRHTAIAQWIAFGANPKQVATRAGHTSVSFTLDRYGHLLPDADDALVDALDADARRVLPEVAGTGRVLELNKQIGEHP